MDMWLDRKADAFWKRIAQLVWYQAVSKRWERINFFENLGTPKCSINETCTAGLFLRAEKAAIIVIKCFIHFTLKAVRQFVAQVAQIRIQFVHWFAFKTERTASAPVDTCSGQTGIAFEKQIARRSNAPRRNVMPKHMSGVFASQKIKPNRWAHFRFRQAKTAPSCWHPNSLRVECLAPFANASKGKAIAVAMWLIHRWGNKRKP